MNLFSVLLAWLLAMTASAVSTPDHFAPPFRVFAWNPNSPIHNLPMTASSLSFFLGGNTTTFCPPSLNGNCPPGNETVLAFNGTAMDVLVPGGQRVYVNQFGALSFSQAHSNVLPFGSSIGPFIYHPLPGNSGYYYYTYTGQGASGFMSCPTMDGRHEVFANMRNASVPTGNLSDCTAFWALGATYKGQDGFNVAAFQYV